jgi:hypothetical protein
MRRRPRSTTPRLAAAACLLLGACAMSRTTTAAAGGATAGASTAVPTRLVVHVITHDAKLIGSAVGGVRITVRDAASGRLLAEGMHEGGTGDTKRLMQDPRRRGDTLFTAPDGARFEATIPLSTPSMVEITAEGPVGYPDQMARTSKRLVLVPGRDVGGDGVVLEMHGYVIDLLGPDTTAALPAGSDLAIRARVRMLCSCPTQPGGMWEVESISARLWQGGTLVHEAPLSYAGEPSSYAGRLPSAAPGTYLLEVVAASPRSASFGVVRRRVRIGG